MANWKEYTTKTTPEDADEIVIADTKANANKRTPFSGLWNWIAGKLATAVISQLETQNKSIIPAINELSSKGKNSYMLRTGTNDGNDIKLNTPSRCTIMAIFNTAGGYASTLLIVIDPNSQCTITGITNDSRVQLKISLDGGILTISENPWLTATLISTSPLSEIK